MEMDSLKKIEILCEANTLRRLEEVVGENQVISLTLFPLSLNSDVKQLLLSDVSLSKGPTHSNSSDQTNSRVNSPQELAQLLQALTKDQTRSRSRIKFTIDEKVLRELFKGLIVESLYRTGIHLQQISNLLEVNRQLLQQCCIQLKFPEMIFEEVHKNSTIQINGFKFNEKGVSNSGSLFLHMGKFVKFLSNVKSVPQGLSKQVLAAQDRIYQKRQLKNILEAIAAILSLDKALSIGSAGNKVLFENLKKLGENFYHSQKYLNNPTSVLPLLSFQIQILCSVEATSQQNQIIEQTIAQRKKKQSSFEVCVNLSQGIDACEQQIFNFIANLINELNSSTSTDSNKIYGDERLFQKSSTIETIMPQKLCNPHFFLKQEDKEKHLFYFTKGLYEYYHYGDSNFNDQGWGCAYRSLQTMLSWFKQQRFINLLSIPTIPEIQSIIDTIDYSSQSKLYNTNTWIGATEVSWVIKKTTGFDCRILHLKDGNEIIEQLQIFREHFEKVGTPIMYGGDQYAYSIVGIHYSWKLGQAQFAILDPHYNGSDKIEKIIEKKGIAWRSPQEMFKKGIFYNFCMPIIPVI